MKSNSKKHGGFGLIEIVISMAIIAIMSIAIYDGLMIIIKQTKAGQVKQAAALEGKKIFESMQATSFAVSGNELDLGNNMTFQEKEDDSGNVSYTRNSDNYVETVTLTRTQAYETPQTTGQSVQLNTNDTSDLTKNKLYISKRSLQDYISYTPAIDSSAVPMPSNSQSSIEMSVYFTTDRDGNQIIDIKDYTGQDLFQTPIIITTDDENLVINFSNYINADGSIPTNENIELDIYNKLTTTIPKIYIEKPQELNVNVQALKGEINLYNNRSENPQADNVGTLYDIELKINDNNSNNLFTGYYKKNIH